jgi:hypothetical protein
MHGHVFHDDQQAIATDKVSFIFQEPHLRDHKKTTMQTSSAHTHAE